MSIDSLLEKLSKVYGKDFLSISNTFESGYRNKGYVLKDVHANEYNLVIYKDERGIDQTIRRANFVSNYLFSLGFPARKAVKTTKGTEILQLRPKKLNKAVNTSSKNFDQNGTPRFACLYNYLPGKTIPWEGYTMKHIKLLGWVMSDMHAELKTQNAKFKTSKDLSNVIKLAHELGFSMVFDVIKEQMRMMHEYFQEEGVSKAMKKKLELGLDINHFYLLGRHIEQIERELDILDLQTVLHMDLVRGNALFDRIEEIQNSKFKIQKNEGETGDRNNPSIPTMSGEVNQHLTTNNSSKTYNLKPITLTGVIDFEKVAIGPAIVDIARTLAFLLIDCRYKDEEKIRKYFLESGYAKRGKSSLIKPTNQLRYLETLMIFFWLYDFYKFLKHNPYEFLRQNEHYLRTKQKLLQQKILCHSI